MEEKEKKKEKEEKEEKKETISGKASVLSKDSEKEEKKETISGKASVSSKDSDKEIVSQMEKEKLGDVEKVANKVDERATFGLGYFFGENAVPPEVEDWMESLKGYTDGMNPALKCDNRTRNR